jgi:hypothetical protein
MRTSSRATAVVAGVIVAAVGPLGSPAGAEPLEKGHFHDTGSELQRFCGLNLRYDFDVTGSYRAVPQGRDGLIHFSENAHGTESFTNLATNKSLIHDFAGTVRDRKVVDNGDGTLTIDVLATGGDHWYSSDGTVDMRDPGQTRFRFVVDHGGTPSDPSDDEQVGDATIVKGSTGRNDTQGHDFCTDLRAATD